MDWLAWLLMTLLMILGIFLMFIVLLQRGRGGGLAGAFGGMGGQSAFGTKAGDVFTRITVVVAVLWVLLAAVSGLVVRAASEPDREIFDGARKAADEAAEDDEGVPEKSADPLDGPSGRTPLVPPGDLDESKDSTTSPEPSATDDDKAPDDEKPSKESTTDSSAKPGDGPADESASKTSDAAKSEADKPDTDKPGAGKSGADEPDEDKADRSGSDDADDAPTPESKEQPGTGEVKPE